MYINTISERMIEEGIKKGYITFIADPNMGHGTVCKIGPEDDDSVWFYFGGATAEEYDPDEYLAVASHADIVRSIWEVLEDFRKTEENVDEWQFCYSFLTERLATDRGRSKWSEVRCDYFDEDLSAWTVDAWTSCDPNAEGAVIAHIDDLTGRVFYSDPDARWDKYAQEVISDKLKELDVPITIHRDGSGDFNVSLQTSAGRIEAEFETSKNTGSGYDAVYLVLRPEVDSDEYVDLCAARVMDDKKHRKEDVSILRWNSPAEDDYDENIISKEDMIDAFESEDQ